MYQHETISKSVFALAFTTFFSFGLDGGIMPVLSPVIVLLAEGMR